MGFDYLSEVTEWEGLGEGGKIGEEDSMLDGAEASAAIEMMRRGKKAPMKVVAVPFASRPIRMCINTLGLS